MRYAERVRAGIALLDERIPNWHKQINLPALDLSSCYECVLGQLFGSFSRGAASLCEEDAAELGFEVFDDEDYDGANGGFRPAYRTLTRLWTYAIRLRQAESREIAREAIDDRTRDAGGLE